MVVPLSAAEMRRKVDAIQRHQSQKDRPLFPGADPREFWQRALARNEARALGQWGQGLGYMSHHTMLLTLKLRASALGGAGPACMQVQAMRACHM